jgi:hypothetical protein
MKAKAQSKSKAEKPPNRDSAVLILSKNIGSAQGTAEKPADSAEKLHEPPLWSVWNFHNKRRDWLW